MPASEGGAALSAAAVAVVAVLAVLAAGCASETKSGGTAMHAIRIVMQTPDEPEPDAEYFINQVRTRSHGRIQILEGGDYSSSNPNNEARLVRDLRSGKVQMAYVPSRAWERVTPVTTFRALQAPLLVTNYRLLLAITRGAIGRSMLAGLDSIGVVGLGLVPDELRRLLGRKPLDSAASLRGARIRVVTSPTGVLALRSLGANPLTNFTSSGLGSGLRSDRLDGAELSTVAILNNQYVPTARYLTANLALFAKTQTIAIRRSVFKRLSSSEKAVLRAAAAATVAHADPAAQEQNDEKQVCSRGLRLVQASSADSASLRRLARAAYAVLARDAATRKELGAIEQLKRRERGTSVLPACPRKPTRRPNSQRNALAGTYVMTASVSEIDRAAGNHGAVDNWGSFRLVLRNGRFRMSDQRPGASPVQGSSYGYTAGRYLIQGDRITFTAERTDTCTSSVCARFTRPIGGPGDPPVICRWSLYRGALTFQQLPAAARARATARGLDPGGPPALYVKPWEARK